MCTPFLIGDPHPSNTTSSRVQDQHTATLQLAADQTTQCMAEVTDVVLIRRQPRPLNCNMLCTFYDLSFDQSKNRIQPLTGNVSSSSSNCAHCNCIPGFLKREIDLRPSCSYIAEQLQCWKSFSEIRPFWIRLLQSEFAKWQRKLLAWNIKVRSFYYL